MEGRSGIVKDKLVVCVKILKNKYNFLALLSTSRDLL